MGLPPSTLEPQRRVASPTHPAWWPAPCGGPRCCWNRHSTGRSWRKGSAGGGKDVRKTELQAPAAQPEVLTVNRPGAYRPCENPGLALRCCSGHRWTGRRRRGTCPQPGRHRRQPANPSPLTSGVPRAVSLEAGSLDGRASTRSAVGCAEPLRAGTPSTARVHSSKPRANNSACRKASIFSSDKLVIRPSILPRDTVCT